MKKILLLIIANAALLFNINAKVYHGGDLRISSQAEIDTFNYTEVEGNLFIEEAVPGTITNLHGLRSLTKISPGAPGEYSYDGALVIQLNTALKNLDGLENLRSVVTIEMNGNAIENINGLSGITLAQDIGIGNNHHLKNLDGFSNLDSVSSYFSIMYNDSLESLEGLSGMLSALRVEIAGNPLLESLKGLDNLRSTEVLMINDNVNLKNVDGLAGLISIGRKNLTPYYPGLYISGNPSLQNLDGLSNLTYIYPLIEITDNASLTSVRGLINVSSSPKTITISGNNTLPDIDGLNNIKALTGFEDTYRDGTFIISDNPMLKNIDGLSGIESVIRGDISNNSSLENIDGLSGLRKIRTLTIRNNDVLRDVDGLSNLTDTVYTIQMLDNTRLVQFCGLYNLLTEGYLYSLILENNGANPTREEIIADCSPLDRSFIMVMPDKPARNSDDPSGGGMFILNNTHDTLKFYISLCNLNGNVTEAHIHNAVKDSAGPVIKDITESFSGGSAAGIWTSSDASPLTPALINELLGGNLYVDVQTASIGEGEFRGQITSEDITLYADLSGDQEVPPVDTDAKGSGTFLLSGDGKSLKYHIIYENLSSPFTGAHFHKARAGSPGPVVRPIDFDGNSASGAWTQTDDQPLTPSLVADLLGCADLYVNIHSADYPDGELRGQILRQRIADDFPYMTFWAVNDADADGTVGSLFYYTLSEVHYFRNKEGNIEGIGRKDIEDLTIADDGTIYLVNNFHTSKIYRVNPDQFDKDSTTPVRAEYVGDTKLPAGALPEEIASLSFIDGTLYGIGKETKILYSINTGDGSVTKLSELNADEFRTDGLVRGADSVVYLLKTVLHGPSEIWKFDDFPDGDISFITAVQGSGKLESIAAHPNGNLYAADEHNLFEINLSEGTIGILDDYSLDIEGMAFNYRTEMFKPVQAVRKFRIIGTLTDVSEEESKPVAYDLSRNYPNPFNPSTLINYSIPEEVLVRVDIFNALGEFVRTLVNEVKTAGTYQVTFDAEGLPSGVYICRFKAGSFERSNKIMLMK